MWRIAVACLTLALLFGPAAAIATEEEPPTAGAFSPAGSFAEGRNGHTATALSDGRVLIIGGGGEQIRHSVDIWNPATASFEQAGSLAAGRKSHTATLLRDGRVLVVGDLRPTAEAEIWDPVRSSPEPVGQLDDARSRHTATLLSDGRVLVVGGWTRPGWLASAEVWDPATASFSPTGSLAEARADHTATLLSDGRVLVIGGHGADGPVVDASGRRVYPDEPRTLAEVWDPETGRFSQAGTLAEGHTSHTATLLPDGRVLIIGDRSAQVWDPATTSSAPAGWLIDAVGGTATLLPDGRVLVVGATSAEVWEPTLASFVPAGTLAMPRWPHTATFLDDGRVLIMAGSGRGVSSTAEVWEPRELPQDQVRALAAESSYCGELRAAYGERTTGDPQLDREYLARCLSCEELLTLIRFFRVADMEMGLALFQDRCGQWRSSPLPAEG